MPTKNGRTNAYELAVIGLISCSMLMYEILLTRVCALRLFFHFGFLVISNCLLGIGASGALISIYQETFKKRPRFWITLFSFLYLVSLVPTYAFLLTFHIRESLSFSHLADLLRFSTYNLVAALPFIFAGAVVGMILTFNAERVNKAYFTDLVGAGLGCLLCPYMLWKWGAGGCFVFLALLALTGTVAALYANHKRAAVAAGVIFGALGLALLPKLDRMFPVPGKLNLDFTDTVRMPITRYPDFSKWSSNSRIDLVPVAEEGRFIFGRGKNVSGLPPIPEEKLILQDGTAGTFIVNFSENPEALQIIEHSTYSAAMQLKDSPRVFIIGMGGGIDVWAAKIWNARFVKAIELNKAILDIHRDVLPNYSRVLLDDPNIQMVVAEGRGALMRETDEYDVIQMSGIDTWTALTSGSYVLAEDYLYTREAVMSMYAHLAPEGILQITRFAGVAESLRVLSNIYSAFEAEGILDFDKSVICISDRLFMTFLVKKGTFTAEEMGKIARFSDELQLEKVYIPDRNSGALAETFIRTDDKEAFIRKCSRNISPTTDDRPYFFFFSRWLSPFKKDAYYSWKPSTAFEVKPFFIVFQLILSTVLSLVLIVLPLVIFARKGIDYAWFKRFFVYFAGLGLGFIGIEIALMQKLTLFLGHPLYSITVTLFSILVFAGLGSLLSASWFRLPDRRVWLVPLGLAVLLGMFIVLSPGLTAYCIRLPLPARIAIAIGCLAPISLLLGVPFAYGIRLLNKLNPSIVPWAWAVNGCCTVIGSILAMVLSMNLGFNAVLIIAVLTYIVAFGALGESR